MNKSYLLPKRSARDTFWLPKHLLYTLLGGQYFYPEDFWFGSEEIWNFSQPVKLRFVKIWILSFSGRLCSLFLAPLIFHIVAMLIRPDVVKPLDFLSYEKISGMLFFAVIFLALLISLLDAIAHVKAKSILR